MNFKTNSFSTSYAPPRGLGQGWHGFIIMAYKSSHDVNSTLWWTALHHFMASSLNRVTGKWGRWEKHWNSVLFAKTSCNWNTQFKTSREKPPENLCGTASLTVLSLRASPFLGWTSGSGSLRGRHARDLTWSFILMTASDIDLWIAVIRFILGSWSERSQVNYPGAAARPLSSLWSMASAMTTLSSRSERMTWVGRQALETCY